MIANIKYHTDGKTIKSFYVIQENDVRRGSCESYYRNGQPCKRGAYKDGKEDGLFLRIRSTAS